MAQMECDLKTRLDWVAVDHHNTGHAHSHIVVRPVTDDGKNRNIAGDCVAYGIRQRASGIVAHDLGPQSECAVKQKLGREVRQERLTRLDWAILIEANEIRSRRSAFGRERSYLGGTNRYLLIKRLKKLERLGLARESEPLRWSLDGDMAKTLRELGELGDIIKTMHRALTEHGIVRGAADYVVIATG